MHSKFLLKPLLLILWVLLVVYTNGYAQSNLQKVISINNIDHQRIETVLKKISATGNFNFAYNNSAVPADSVISISTYRGTIYAFLNKLLGPDYEYKEVPGYIILRHAPLKLNLTAEINNEPEKPIIIKGHVTDIADKKGVNQASVYEKNLLISTLTDEHGDFEIKLKNWTGSVILTAVKENYRDTAISILQEVRVTSTPSKKIYKYYPDANHSNRLERSFGRFFISSRQKIQNLNLEGFFAYSPYQLSLTPGLSTHGMYNSQVINHFSMNILGGYTAGISGAELAGVFNIDRNDVNFLQLAGVFNIVGGNERGVQIAGIYNNVLNTASGMQGAGIVNKVHVFNGFLQLAGLANIADTARGFEIGGIGNKTGNFNGVLQMGGVINIAENAKGLQLSGLANVVKGNADAQFAGLFNVASKVKGIQLAGLLNVADSSDYPIGFINLIKNGRKSLSLSTDESRLIHTDFRSGGKVLYGLVGFGYKFQNDPIKYAFDLGFGAHLKNSTTFILDAELTYQIAADANFNNSYQINSFKILPGYKISRIIRLYAGPSLNFMSADAADIANTPGWQLHKSVNGNNANALYMGLSGGLQFEW